MPEFGLPPESVTAIRNVLSSHSEITTVLLYGSRAKGTYKNGSDIDLTIMDKDIDSRLINRLEQELDDLYLPYSIDLSLFDHIDNENLIDHIKRVGVVFYNSR